ncbi:MAG: extensin family protein [Sulfitobacter sp.]
MIRAAAVMVIFGVPVAAQDLAPATSAIPLSKQGADAVASTPPDAAATVKDGPDTQKISKGMRDQLAESDVDYAACLATLDEMGVVYTEVAPLIPEGDADCGILRPLSVTEVLSDVAIEPAAIIRCETAKAVSLWTRDFVIPASERLPERGALVGIQNGSGYICRRRNNLPDGKLSEHAFGNAIDVMGFDFEDGSTLKVEPREAEGSMAEAFQDAVRASACLNFATVLGPGSNASHADHLHMDIIARNSGYRLCEQGGAEPD